jgi:anti-sigma regulatory factor (Ser/Thr protein kinase)
MELSDLNSQESEPLFDEMLLHNGAEDLIAMSEWIQQQSTRMNCSKRLTFRLELVLEEVVTNIITHADRDEVDRDIYISLTYGANVLTVQVKDRGYPFDPLQQQEIDLPDRLEDSTVGGLGIHLIRSYTDKCHYCRQQNENILTLIFFNTDGTDKM